LRPYYYSVEPDAISGKELDQLLALGWYRMHQYLFTCSHIGVDEPYRVHWLRYPLSEIKEASTHRKIRRRNQPFRVSIEDANSIRADHKELYQRYRSSIKFDGALSIEDSLFGGEERQSIFTTKAISVYDRDVLIAGGYYDLGELAAASILHFFDPNYHRFSLGKFLILITLDFLKKEGYQYYYPGYVVAGNPKMDYKLFLGRRVAQYFDPEKVRWTYFNENILIKQSTDRDYN